MTIFLKLCPFNKLICNGVLFEFFTLYDIYLT